ncbi:MAG: DUF1684 domain-containing protein [Vicinamibacterales bacterium]|jgi:hypothetical protein|nr:DUF1684 domain-containing protein [Vicinamibacterales bacterium]
MQIRTRLLLLVALVGVPSLSAVRANDYEDEIEAWRIEREATLKADDGWLTVSALFFLREGPNSFGSSQRNDFVLPDHVPAEAGVFTLRDGQVMVHAPADGAVIVNGEPVTAAQLYPSDNEATLTIGSVSFWVHVSGDRLAIRVRDTESEIRKRFTTLDWYPVDQRYQVRGKFTPHAEPITVKTMNILGDIETYTSTGYVTLTVAGTQVRMLPVNSDRRLWFIMRDLTSSDETYSAARFLYADAPDADGWTTVDFNKAYNPPCAFNPHTTCPLPPPDNRLDVRIEAGEKNYSGPGAH